MPDPLLCDFPLSLHRRFYPLGFPLDLFTNSEAVLTAGRLSWGEFERAFHRPAVSVRIGITDDPHSVNVTPVYRGRRNLVAMNADGGSFAVCDLSQRFGFAWLNAALTQDLPFLRYFWLEAMGYVLVSASWLAAVHAACIDWNGRGVLLCGESGAGKSSLAWACARAGWNYVCDDASFLVRGENTLLVTGNPHQIRLRESATELFPEFAGTPVMFRPNGKPTLEIPTRTRTGIRIVPTTVVHHVLFLDRNTGSLPSISPFPKEEALRRWSEVIVYGDEDSRSQQRDTLQRLLAAGIHGFRYSDVESAVNCLDAMFRPPQKAA